MTIRFHCEHCRRTVEAPDSAGGRRGKCPYCEGSNYIPTPGDEEEIALTPLDESTERLRRQEVRDLLEAERDLLSETSHGANPSPRLSERDPSEVKSEDLHHIVVNYALDMTLGDLERAGTHVQTLRKYGSVGRQAVDDFLSGRKLEPALDKVPVKVLQGFLRNLLGELRSQA
ncbi:MAG: hypothetical protein GX591_11680 [Planctomycetes bacterium]|nr:hypothetical protein [Planctomycetota bacterium]